MHKGHSAVREVDLSTKSESLSRSTRRRCRLAVARSERRPKPAFCGVNPAAERELCAPVKFAVGKPITECFPKLLETHVPEMLPPRVLTGMPDTFGEVAYRDAHIPAGIFWMDCFPLPERCVGLTLENITKRKRLTDNQSIVHFSFLHRVTLFI